MNLKVCDGNCLLNFGTDRPIYTYVIVNWQNLYSLVLICVLGSDRQKQTLVIKHRQKEETGGWNKSGSISSLLINQLITKSITI